jgi:hypothetical protein
MKKNIISILFCIILLTPSCGSSKPSWERKDKPHVTQNDHAVLGILFSAMILFSLHTFTTR